MKWTKFKYKIILKIFYLIIGAAVTLNGIVLSFTTNFNLGNLLTLLLGGALLFCGIFLDTVVRRLPKWIKIAFVAALIFVVGFASFLLGFGTTDTVTHSEDAIIVLGAAVQGEKPSRVLKDRLNTAIEYYSKNPNALIIVSGGQGPQETVTEAAAMKTYLIKNGVAEDVIIKEEKATSTYENFVFSKKILDEHFDNTYSAAFITDEYHIYRAGGIAQNAGLKTSAHAHSSTRWYSVLPGTLRECAAVIKFWIFGN